jgi:hypothetical protein
MTSWEETEYEVSAAIIGVSEGDDDSLFDARESLSSECWKGLITYVHKLREQLAQYPAIWHEDSSLETWFTLTAEELKRKTATLEILKVFYKKQVEQAENIARTALR